MMLSYSSNHEDVLLARVFSDQPTGFYIDVGANDPEISSLTKHFYDQGWQGINVEPVPRFYERLLAARPRDINIPCALSNRRGKITLYEQVDHEHGGLSTTSAQIAEAHRQDGRVMEKRTVAMKLLFDICEQHVKGTIDFMSIDVEGHEYQVLQGADFKRFRPRVLLLEATLPNSRTPSHAEWEPLVLSADYVFALFDGVNRYYVRAEEPALLERLQSPVCVFDRFTTLEERDLRRHVEELGRHLAETGRHAAALERHATALERERVALKQRLAESESQQAALKEQLEALRKTYRCVGPGTVAVANKFDALKRRAPGVLTPLNLIARSLS